MNHDATLCLEYDPTKCPKKCYRAELTEELYHRPDLRFLPISWASFKGTEDCPMFRSGRMYKPNV